MMWYKLHMPREPFRLKPLATHVCMRVCAHLRVSVVAIVSSSFIMCFLCDCGNHTWFFFVPA